jgi:hypothetical protein
MKGGWFLLLIGILALAFIPGVQAAVHSTDPSTLVNIKYDNGALAISDQFIQAVRGRSVQEELVLEEPVSLDPAEQEKTLINVLAITKGDIIYTKNIQTPPTAEIYVSSASYEDTNVMQTTTEPGYPVLEVYWGYDKSSREPWRYYLRVNNLNDKYVVISDFKTKMVWTQPITSAKVQGIINGGQIPVWGAI